MFENKYREILNDNTMDVEDMISCIMNSLMDMYVTQQNNTNLR